MNFDEIINHLTELQKDSEIVREITKLVGGKKESVITNLTEIIEDKPLNRAKILDELSECRYLVDEAYNSYDGVYDDIQGARDTIDYMASELDELSDAKHRISDLENMIMRDEEPEEEPVKKTPAKKTAPVKTTFNPTTTQQ
tara:strand:- start:1256 stop:1681 length:426 start_codon:yes stop_codon:yes gene_type:complete